MIICYECGKEIKPKSKSVVTSPPVFAIQIGADFPKRYHAKCYEKSEREACKQLGREYVQPV